MMSDDDESSVFLNFVNFLFLFLSVLPTLINFISLNLVSNDKR